MSINFTQLKRERYGLKESSSLNGNVSNEVQPSARIWPILIGSSGNDRRNVQPLKKRNSRLDSLHMAIKKNGNINQF